MSDLAVDATRGGVRSGPAGEVVPLRSPDQVPNNLPLELTSFVGRERELGELAEALAETRILTLTGAGGCGKSRLALQAAAESLDRYPEGAWWVELAPISEPALVAPVLAQVFGLRPLPGQSELEAAVSYLTSRRALILLDNCEHLLDASARIAEALALGCPRLTVLATSREPLRVGGETDWRVPSMSLPPEADGGAEEVAERSDAVRLFVERATKVRPGFLLSDETAPSLVRICTELDGIPLAIELAAARLRLLSVEQIADGLTDRFRLLTGGGRTGLPRHRTLRASVDWSYELLSEAEGTLFRRLGVFVGGFTLEAAERICSADSIAPDQVLDLLASLIERSLVQAEERDSAVRYRLLETVRHYALERLADAGEAERIRDRHRDLYLEVAERIAPGLFSPRQPELLDLLDPEAANLTQAIECAAETEPEKALRLSMALMMWWRLRGYFAQGEAGYRRALEATGEDPSVLRARALVGRAYLLTYAGAYEAAVPAVQQALAEAEGVGDEWTIAVALDLVGTLTLFPDPVGSRAMLERARKLASASGEEYLLMGATSILGFSYCHQDDHARARPLLEEALALAERLVYPETIAWHWGAVGWAYYVAGEHGRCREACERGIAEARKLGDPASEGAAQAFLALCEIDAGTPESALPRLGSIRERALVHGGAFTLPWVELAIALGHAADGRLEDARSAFEALIEYGAGGAATILSWARVGLAEALRLLGDVEQAGDHATGGLELGEQIGNGLREAQARLVLGRLAARRGEWAEAQRLHHEALSSIVDHRYYVELPSALEALAGVAAGLESLEESVRILSAAKRVRRELGLVAWMHQREELEALTKRIRDTLGTTAFAQTFADGEGLSIDEAVAYVRRARGSRKRPSGGWESLTPTELEVARHAAEGLTNPEIGERMFISRGTVKTHLTHIYAKLGIKNRLELGAQAARRAGAPDR